MPAQQVQDEDMVLSLKRGLDVLRCFKVGDGPLSVSQIATRTSLPRQTANRLVYSLAQLGCLDRRQADGRYLLGPRPLGLGRSVLANLPIRSAVHPIMQRLADKCDTSVGLGVAHELEMVYIEYCVSSRTVSFWLRVGSIIPLATTAMGRAYLWAIDRKRRTMLLAQIKREAGSQAAGLMASIDRSFRELDQSGFCSTFPSSRDDICGVGAPLVFNNGDTVLALNCGAATLGLDERRFRDKCGPALVKAVADIKKAVGNVDADYLGVAYSLGLG